MNVLARDLSPGDRIRDREGEWVTVVDVGPLELKPGTSRYAVNVRVTASPGAVPLMFPIWHMYGDAPVEVAEPRPGPSGG